MIRLQRIVRHHVAKNCDDTHRSRGLEVAVVGPRGEGIEEASRRGSNVGAHLGQQFASHTSALDGMLDDLARGPQRSSAEVWEANCCPRCAP
ncbi:MAG: hypothetical protein EBZ54_04570, partial [Actinobacteria bacterium]|nr:hypothetical protein [Actinomycetota bacterium]